MVEPLRNHKGTIAEPSGTIAEPFRNQGGTTTETSIRELEMPRNPSGTKRNQAEPKRNQVAENWFRISQATIFVVYPTRTKHVEPSGTKAEPSSKVGFVYARLRRN